jgi:hypothetical protein
VFVRQRAGLRPAGPREPSALPARRAARSAAREARPPLRLSGGRPHRPASSAQTGRTHNTSPPLNHTEQHTHAANQRECACRYNKERLSHAAALRSRSPAQGEQATHLTPTQSEKYLFIKIK